jgi:YidC/Oxa1 family membrane protein insertase
MEKRAILAFGLSALLLFVYVWAQEHYFVAPPKPAETRPSPPAPAAPPSAPTASPQKEVPPPSPVPRTAEAGPAPRPPQRTVPADAPLYRAVVSSEGGKLLEWTLHYRGEKPMIVVGELGPAGLIVAPPNAKAGEPVPMSIRPDSLRLERPDATGALDLQGRTDGFDVKQTMRFTGDSYTVAVRVSIRNVGPTTRAVAVLLPWSTRPQWGETPKFIGQHPTEIVWSAHRQVDRLDNLAALPEQEIEGEWIGVDTIWYLAALIPKSGGFKLFMRSEGAAADQKSDKNAAAGRATIGLRATPSLGPGQTWEGDVLMFIGPKEYEQLKAAGLEDTLNFGGFPLPRRWGGLPMEWLGVPILLLMKWVYSYVHNYGVAIILLTLISKILFYPLTVRSLRSMKAMQALQPQVNALRARYKSDPQRAQREMMELYRKHKVNPMGGCLPMVAQVPIFYALYLALSVSVELQNAAFLCSSWLDPFARALRWLGAYWVDSLWICDLANPDPLYILPLLMGVTMFVQQKMSPTMGDPRQAKMMLVMPFVFTIMFVNLASGLVLYWTVSNLIQILQQWYMERPRARAAIREAKDESAD